MMIMLKYIIIGSLFFLITMLFGSRHFDSKFAYKTIRQNQFDKKILLVDEPVLKLIKQDSNTSLDVLKRKILFASPTIVSNIHNILLNIQLIYIFDDPAKDYIIFRHKDTKRALTRFKTVPTKINLHNNSIDVLIPKDIDKFLWSWKHGRFLDCKKVNVIGRHSSTRQVIPLTFIKNMALFRDLLAKYTVTGFLMGGSLLGWYRECSIIPHTTDIDFGMLSEKHSEPLIEDLKTSSDFTLYWKLGMPNDSMEISVYKDNIKMDLFYVYKDKVRGGSYVAGMLVAERQKLRWNYPKIKEICTGDLLDHLMYLPCNIDKVIEADYGKEWAKDFDTSKFEWSKSHKNLEKGEAIPASQWKYMYQKFVNW